MDTEFFANVLAIFIGTILGHVIVDIIHKFAERKEVKK